MPESAAYQWRKRGRAVSFASPGTLVQPVILGRADNAPEVVQVKRTYESSLRRLVAMLTGNIFSRAMTHLGREAADDDRVYFERWATPHPHGIIKPLYYLFGGASDWSGPLSVSNAVVAIETRTSTVSASFEHAGANLAASRGFEGQLQGKIGTERDPTFTVDCLTPYTSSNLRGYLEDYLKELSSDLEDQRGVHEDLIDVAYREYADYLDMGKESVRMEVSVRNRHVTVAENSWEAFDVDIVADGPGCMMFVVVATDESSGIGVSSPLVGLRATKDGVIHLGFE